MHQILEGIVVLDVASYIAAPVAATIMADFGASVIKVEPPGGDSYRGLLNNPGMPAGDVDFHWHVTNRNKRGIALDLMADDGRAALDRLVSRADVLITNFPSRTRTRLRLDYPDVKAVNPALIYATLSAYGESGGESANPGFDSTAYWARSGLMHMVRPDPDGGPARSAPGQGDHPSGVALFGAIMLALYERRTTGEGAHVHTSLMANGLWANAFNAQAALSGLEVPLRPRREELGNALTNHYRAADGRWFILAILNQDRDWPRLLEALDAAHLADDPRFATREARNANGPALSAVLDGIIARRDLAWWRTRLNEKGLTIGVVGSHEDVPSDQQMRDSGALRSAASPEHVGASHVVDSPMWIEGRTKAAVCPAPAVGAQTREVLAEAGFSEREIEDLIAKGVAGTA